jgi:uncharacterized protein (TIGR02246 family)
MKLFILTLMTIFAFQGAYSQTVEDEKAIETIIHEMADAWTNADGKKWAQAFAEEHDLTVWNGLYFPNTTAERNATSHQELFDGRYKDTKHYVVLDKIRFIKEDVAITHSYSAITKSNEAKPEYPQVLWSTVMIKIDGKWKIVSFHNVDLETLESEESRAQLPMPARVMYKNWWEKDIN